MTTPGAPKSKARPAVDVLGLGQVSLLVRDVDRAVAVEDIAATYAQLEAAGVKMTDAPNVIYTDEETGVQEWMAFFEDSEGNALAVLSRVPAGVSS